VKAIAREKKSKKVCYDEGQKSEIQRFCCPKKKENSNKKKSLKKPEF
jgi:hypothetical protein